jgi:hypothetical protein
MKRSRICSSTLTVLLTVFAIAAGAVAGALGIVSGRIIDVRSGLPVSGATIILQSGSSRVAKTTTASDGSFTGYIGLGTYQPENQYGTDANAFDQASELFGLPYRSFRFVIAFQGEGPSLVRS